MVSADTREIELLWETLEKQGQLITALSASQNAMEVKIAVLQLKASLWTIVGAFIATALWFVKEIAGAFKGK